MFNLNKFAALQPFFERYEIDPKKAKSGDRERVNALVADFLVQMFGEGHSENLKDFAFYSNISPKRLHELFTLPINEIKTFAEIKRDSIVEKGAVNIKIIQNHYKISDEIMSDLCVISTSSRTKYSEKDDRYTEIINELKEKYPKNYSNVFSAIRSEIYNSIYSNVLKKEDDWKTICLKPRESVSIINQYAQGSSNYNEILNFFNSLPDLTIGNITEKALGIYASKPYSGELFIGGKINPEFTLDIMDDVFGGKKLRLDERAKNVILNSLKSENPSSASMNLRQLCKSKFNIGEFNPILIERKRFSKDHNTDDYLKYVGLALIDHGFESSEVNNMIETIKNEYSAYVKGIPDPDFGENSRDFSSAAEADMIVNYVRNLFNLTCIPSGIHIPVPHGVNAAELPKTKDPSQPFDRFRIDFVIFCDKLEVKNDNGVMFPYIKPNMMLVGEYYGIQDDEKYDIKREIKEATENYFADALNCGYFEIMPERKENWIKQIADGLDKNSALYVPQGNAGEKILNTNHNAPINKLKNWWSTSDDMSKQKFISDNNNARKYLDINTGNINVKQEKYNKFEGLIRECRNRIESEFAEKAITLIKSDESNPIYSYDTVLEWNRKWKELNQKLVETKDPESYFRILSEIQQARQSGLRNFIEKPIQEGTDNNQWKFNELNILESEIKSAPENKINSTNLCGLVYRLTDKQTSESYWKSLKKSFQYRVVEAMFNLYKYVKGI